MPSVLGTQGKVTLIYMVWSSPHVGYRKSMKNSNRCPNTYFLVSADPLLFWEGLCLSWGAQSHLQPCSTAMIICAKIHDDLPNSYSSWPKQVSSNLNDWWGLQGRPKCFIFINCENNPRVGQESPEDRVHSTLLEVLLEAYGTVLCIDLMKAEVLDHLCCFGCLWCQLSDSRWLIWVRRA